MGYFASFEDATARAEAEALARLDPSPEEWRRVRSAPPARRKIRAGRRR
jgi:hypothetical protein